MGGVPMASNFVHYINPPGVFDQKGISVRSYIDDVGLLCHVAFFCW